MENRSLTCEKKDGVLVIRIHPVKTWEEVVQLSGELRDLCRETLLDQGPHVVVLTEAEENAFLIDPETVRPGSEEDRIPGIKHREPRRTDFQTGCACPGCNPGRRNRPGAGVGPGL